MPRAGDQASNNADADKISITVEGQDGTKVVYKILRKAKLTKLMHAYCQKKQLDYRAARFLLDGHRIYGKYSADKQLQHGYDGF